MALAAFYAHDVRIGWDLFTSNSLHRPLWLLLVIFEEGVQLILIYLKPLGAAREG